jgi:hypothetical protein
MAGSQRGFDFPPKLRLQFVRQPEGFADRFKHANTGFVLDAVGLRIRQSRAHCAHYCVGPKAFVGGFGRLRHDARDAPRPKLHAVHPSPRLPGREQARQPSFLAAAPATRQAEQYVSQAQKPPAEIILLPDALAGLLLAPGCRC